MEKSVHLSLTPSVSRATKSQSEPAWLKHFSHRDALYTENRESRFAMMSLLARSELTPGLEPRRSLTLMENDMTKLAWSRDGDQYVARGIMGEYRISEWIFATGSEFTLNVRRKGDGACKNIGGFSTVANAKTAAENYDGYRSVAA